MSGASNPLSVLERVRRGAPREVPRPGKRCDLCSATIGGEHDHVVDLESRALLCACRGCYLLFAPSGAGGERFRAVPDRYLTFPGFQLTAAQWDGLQIPVSVAFVFRSSALDDMAAFYPGPAGATESLLSLEAWAEVVAANPTLATLEPDVEALLLRADRARGEEVECYLVPVDACYELVGRLRTLWRGFDGGTEAHAALDAFFDGVRRRATVAQPA